MKNEKLIIAAKSSIDDGALRLLIYSISIITYSFLLSIFFFISAAFS